jgi:hypothetical protein
MGIKYTPVGNSVKCDHPGCGNTLKLRRNIGMHGEDMEEAGWACDWSRNATYCPDHLAEADWLERG